MIFIEVFFFVSLFLIFYSYFGYPLSLLVIRIVKEKKIQKEDVFLSVTFVITAFNEERRIEKKLLNTLAIEYPADQLQILVASDGSTDKTNRIVREFANRRIELIEVQDRRGKENAQKEALIYARGDIIVFSDVATILEPRALKEIVANFADPSVGCVSSVDRLISQDGKPSGEGLYVRYEMWLRRLESSVNSLVGLSGSFFAARKEVCREFSENVQSDFKTLLNSIKLGLRGVIDPEAIGSYLNISDEKRELERKERTVIRGITVFFGHLEFLNPVEYGVFSYQLFCHKLLRWLVPFFLIGVLLTNIFLAFYFPFFQLCIVIQAIFYGLAVVGLKTPKLQGVFRIPMFFMVVNMAILIAWLKYFKGERIVLWAPSQR